MTKDPMERRMKMRVYQQLQEKIKEIALLELRVALARYVC